MSVHHYTPTNGPLFLLSVCDPHSSSDGYVTSEIARVTCPECKAWLALHAQDKPATFEQKEPQR